MMSVLPNPWMQSAPAMPAEADQATVEAAAAGAPATPAEAHQANMQTALNSLISARGSLHSADTNEGGHRARAITLVDQAIAQVRLGIESAGSADRLLAATERFLENVAAVKSTLASLHGDVAAAPGAGNETGLGTNEAKPGKVLSLKQD